eukprot:CAMPEP_0113672244 /NCGR_PEP_ID=MMETSP0038_2-20120614/6151_1 /TAXON_ID=2898 /ORGANISM="Cryptomonas paramecium" /LENGTH=187 /DNA_ID=CAMNT_0000588483 /DNA_START=776 /DNA_END=1338 /DNA_ORIENTATION=- /assembly_acc=CAM_ASM_000170
MEMFEAGEAELWWAGKQMEQGQERALRDYVGRNDKTKVIAKLQRRGGGAPAGEPPVDEQTQRDMMAFWHKKQEEAKRLAEEDEDAHLGAAWADPRQLRSHLQGTGGGTVALNGSIPRGFALVLARDALGWNLIDAFITSASPKHTSVCISFRLKQIEIINRAQSTIPETLLRGVALGHRSLHWQGPP